LFFRNYQYPESVVIRSDNGKPVMLGMFGNIFGLIGCPTGISALWPHLRKTRNIRSLSWHPEERKFFKRVDYRNFGEIEADLKKIWISINNTRLHGSVGRITPMEKWNQD